MKPLIPPGLPAAVLAALVAVVAVAAVHDLRARKIPNWIPVTGFAFGFLLNGYVGGWAGVGRAGMGFAVAFTIYFALYLLHAMGAGDVKLMAAIGALTGVHFWIVLFAITSITGATLGIILAVSKGRLRSTLWNTAYVARELISGRAPWLSREQLDVKNPASLRLPHAVTIAIGVAVTILLSRSRS